MDELLERGANMEARTKGGCGCKLFQHTGKDIVHECKTVVDGEKGCSISIVLFK
jgi:uncharacterized Zn finger protein (UPF0148 family)